MFKLLKIKYCTVLVMHAFALEHGCANHDTEGKRFKFPDPLRDVTKPPYLISGELCTSPLHCLRTPCADGAPSSASLCSEHINQT